MNTISINYPALIDSKTPQFSFASNRIIDKTAISEDEKQSRFLDINRTGAKYGTLAAVILGSQFLANTAEKLIFQLQISPNTAMTAVGISLLLAPIVISMEEAKIGIGKNIGKTIGKAAGFVADRLNLLENRVENKHSNRPLLNAEISNNKENRTIQEKVRDFVLGKLPHNSALEKEGLLKSWNIGAGVGSFAVSLALGTYLNTKFVFSLPSTPQMNAMSQVLSPLIALGGVFGAMMMENYVPVGNTVGGTFGAICGAAGNAVSKYIPKKVVEKPKVSKIEEGLKKAFMNLNIIIGKPWISFFIDINNIFNERFFKVPSKQTMPLKNLDNAVTVDEKRLVDNFIKLAGINGASGNEGEIRKEIIKQLEENSINYKVDETGNIVAKINGTLSDSPALLFSAHMDTVEPTSAKSMIHKFGQVYTNEKKILGGDDRAGIAVILEALKQAKEKNIPHGDITLAFTVAEETGLNGSVKLKKEDITDKKTIGFVLDSLKVENIYLKNDPVLTQASSVGYAHHISAPVVQVAIKAMKDADLSPKTINAPVVFGGGSDANSLALNNDLIQSLNIGNGMNDVHTELENIKDKDLINSSRVVTAIIQNISQLKINEKNEIVVRD